MNLNELSAPLYLGFTYLLVFPIGYLLLDFRAFKKFRIMPFSMRFPIYLAFGLLSSTVIYYVVGLMIIDAQVPIIDIELVEDEQPGLLSADKIQALADSLGVLFNSAEAGTWVRLRHLPRDRYAENQTRIDP